MQPQCSFADVEYDGQPRQTRRERLLRRMDALMPWARLEARIRPVYPSGERGRPHPPLERRLEPASRPERRSWSRPNALPLRCPGCSEFS